MSTYTDSVKSFLPKLILVAVLGLLALPLAVVAVYVGRGSTGHLVIAVVLGLLGAPALALWGAALWLLTWRLEDATLKRRMQWIGAGLLGLAQIAFLLAPSYPPGLLLNMHDVHAARSYCTTLMPRLESYHEAHGAYPVAIDSLLPADRPVPRLLEQRSFYRRVGADYEFAFLDPSPVMGGHIFFSSDRRPDGRWEHWY